MKRTIVFLALMLMTLSYGQETKPVPQITVSGEGKVKVIPDEATVSVSVETKGNVAKDVKKKTTKKLTLF